MTFLTHAVVGLAISKFFAGDTKVLAVTFSVIPDIDHVYILIKHSFSREGFKKMRTVLHELLGMSLWSSIGLVLLLISYELGLLFLVCVLTHLFLDFMSAASQPFRPLLLFKIDFTPIPSVRLLEEVIVIICAGVIILS